MKALAKWSPRAKRTDVDISRRGARWDPFKEMEEEMAVLRDQMDRAFGRWPVQSGPAQMEPVAWFPRVDVSEDDKEYLIQAELPEVKKEQIKVVVRDGLLSISGERREEKEEKSRTYHRIERAYGTFDRGFRLPSDADPAKIKSEFKDGVLNVHLPKVPGLKPAAIEVEVK